MLTILPDVGLILDIAGAAVVAYSSTQPVYVTWTGERYAEIDARTEEVRQETKGAKIEPKPDARKLIRVGWGLIALGFLLQLVG